MAAEAAKRHLEVLLNESYYSEQEARELAWQQPDIIPDLHIWYPEYRFAKPRKFRFDYAVPAILCANHGSGLFCQETSSINTTFNVLLP